MARKSTATPGLTPIDVARLAVGREAHVRRVVAQQQPDEGDDRERREGDARGACVTACACLGAANAPERHAVCR